MYRIIISHLLERFVSLQTSFKCLGIIGWWAEPTLHQSHVIHMTLPLCERMCRIGVIVVQNSTNSWNDSTQNKMLFHPSPDAEEDAYFNKPSFPFILHGTSLYLCIPCSLCPILPAPESMKKHKVEWNKARSRILKVTLNAAASFPTGSTFADY
jgi:hypothetical protein